LPAIPCMTTTSFYLVGGAFVGLVLWLGWREVIWRWRVVRAKPLGARDYLTDPAQQPPGYHVHQVISVTGSAVYDRFTVSVSAPMALYFQARVRTPPGVRLASLQALSDAKSHQVLGSYFKFKKPRGQRWPRDVAEKVAVKLSRLGTCYEAATLEARCGRLVYSWSRIQDCTQLDSQTLAQLAEIELAGVVTLLESAAAP
jgi:hypothetical protein